MSSHVLRVAVPAPLRRLFDYLPPSGEMRPFAPGQRLLVPFGRGKAVGVVVEQGRESALPADRLKPALALLDETPILPPQMVALLTWAADYYHFPVGMVFQAALPQALRQGKPAEVQGIRRWRLTGEGNALGPGEPSRAARQAGLLALLRSHGTWVGTTDLEEAGEGWQAVMRRLVEKGWVESKESPCLPRSTDTAAVWPLLNPAQAEAVEAIGKALGAFQPFLLDGVTGSGKTEVYLSAIEKVVAQGRQALVLVPEIGLTPQLVRRFRRRFAVPVAVLHSALAEGERLCAWLMAARGEAPIVIGTRSAVFTPLAQPGLFIIDEEHDGSFKQQEGLRYSARDLAVLRARREGVPVVLGSATPSLESLQNVERGGYRLLRLPERAGSASLPRLALLDVRHRPLEDGLSEGLIASIGRHLERDGQVLLFLNRRGYAPTLLCHDCAWVSQCRRCDAHMTLYGSSRRLKCHHCGSEQPVPLQCPDCGSPDLRPVGQGTERVEQGLAKHFPNVPAVRIDRDSTRRKGELQARLEMAKQGEARILVGTQMLAKGHHFPQVTLVGILDADQGLFSADFRAGERMAQLILQVSGRAGRAEKPGEVLIQTHEPDHPLLRLLVEADYQSFAQAALAERQAASFPPFTHLALLRAEAVQAAVPLAFLQQAREAAETLGPSGVSLWGPVPAPMERRGGRLRAQLLVQADNRADLHRFLTPWLQALESLKAGRQVRWSLDVDPLEMY